MWSEFSVLLNKIIPGQNCEILQEPYVHACAVRNKIMADTLQKMNPRTLRDRLAAWEAKSNAKAPLSDKQRDSFMELTTQSSNRPLPVEVSKTFL